MLTYLRSFSGISVDDIEKAREFYVEKLKLTLADDSMGLTLELPGGGTLFIYEKEGHLPADFTVLNLVVSNINDTINQLVHNYEISMERYDNLPSPQDDLGVLRGKAASYGPDIAWFLDPAGNTIGLIEE